MAEHAEGVYLRDTHVGRPESRKVSKSCGGARIWAICGKSEGIPPYEGNLDYFVKCNLQLSWAKVDMYSSWLPFESDAALAVDSPHKHGKGEQPCHRLV